MQLSQYPRPPADTGWGFHDSAGVDCRPGDAAGYARYLRQELDEGGVGPRTRESGENTKGDAGEDRHSISADDGLGAGDAVRDWQHLV